jgi:D-glycero-D-manno-heptose 1,7-bisphosphate phosphatase
MTSGSVDLDPEQRSGASGLWHEVLAGEVSARNFAGRPALFLDRDGVIVDDTHYLGRAEDVRMIAGAADAIARCNGLGTPVVLVTNQSGIARGRYDWAAFAAVQAALTAALARAGARLDAVFACAHHADGRPPLNIADHPWRKPNPGMIVAAGERMKLDLAHSWIIGDQVSDVAAGRAAGLAGAILVSPHDDNPEWSAAIGLKRDRFAVDIAASLADAVSLLLAQEQFGLQARRR